MGANWCAGDVKIIGRDLDGNYTTSIKSRGWFDSHRTITKMVLTHRKLR